MAKKQKKMILRGYTILMKYLEITIKIFAINMAGWQSGYAAACKAVYAGSIPASASKGKKYV